MVYFELRPRTKFSTAEVAELADALASGASSRKGVKVRVLSSAPNPSLRSVFGAAASLRHAAHACGVRQRARVPVSHHISRGVRSVARQKPQPRGVPHG